MNTKLFFAFFCVFVAQACGQTAAPECGTQGILASGLSDADKSIVVDRHNYYRLLLANGNVTNQPKASNMKRMVWDNAIAAQAQSLTNTCVFKHIRFTDSRWGPVGQNLYMSMSGNANSKVNWQAAVDMWYNEVNFFTYPNVTVTGKTAGHYTQVVWADSYALGCGFSQYYNPTNKWYYNLVACNYGPAGNYVGAAPYKTGPGCENLC